MRPLFHGVIDGKQLRWQRILSEQAIQIREHFGGEWLSRLEGSDGVAQLFAELQQFLVGSASDAGVTPALIQAGCGFLIEKLSRSEPSQ